MILENVRLLDFTPYSVAPGWRDSPTIMWPTAAPPPVLRTVTVSVPLMHTGTSSNTASEKSLTTVST